MYFKCLSNGLLESNCYIVANNKEAVLIDAGVTGDNIKNMINESGIEIKKIILTHGHIDHICCVNEIAKLFSADVYIHSDDMDMMDDNMMNLSNYIGMDFKLDVIINPLKHNQILSVGDFDYEIIHTPGHTKGGICIKLNDMLFTGDTLFKKSIGRTDFFGGSLEQLKNSIKEKLFIMDDNVVVYPGHGSSSLILHERESNPFLKEGN